MAKVKIRKSLKDEMVSLYKKGYTPNEIALMLGHPDEIRTVVKVIKPLMN